MDNNLIIKARNIVNKTIGTSIALNSTIIDSDCLSFINNNEVYIHFSKTDHDDITIKLSDIINIEIYEKEMNIVTIYTSDNQVISIYCLP